MTYLDKWCEGKPPILAFLVCNLVHGLGDTHLTLSHVVKGNPLELEVPVPARLWRKYYWRNKLFMRLISGLFFGTTDLREVEQNLSEVTADEFLEDIHSQFGDNLNLSEVFGRILLNLTRSDKPIEINAAYALLAGMTFARRVWLPCWLHYARTPLNLLRAAKNGDNQAMEQLLRVDKSAVTIPCLGRRWHEIMTGGNPALRKIMLKAMSGPPGRAPQQSKAKIVVCALTQLLGEKIGHPFSTEDMRELLDALEKDRSGKDINIDTTIPDSNESFAQALLRERKRWLALMKIPKTETIAVS